MSRLALSATLALLLAAAGCASDLERLAAARARLELALANHDVVQAREAVHTIQSLLPEDPESYLEVGLLLDRAGFNDEAAWLFDDAVLRFPANDSVKLASAQNSLQLGDSAGALRVLSGIDPTGKLGARAAWTRGQAELEAGDIRTALLTFEEAERLYPERAFAFRRKRIDALVAERRLDEALSLTDEGAATADEASKQLQFALLRAELLRQTGELHAATEQLQALVDEHPRDLSIRAALTGVRVGSGDPEQYAIARQELRSAIEAHPDLPGLWQLLATAEGALDDEQATEAALRKHWELEPSGATLERLSRFLWERDRADEAVQVLDEGLPRVDERSAATLEFLLASVLLTTDDATRAREVYERFAAANPEDPQTDLLKARFLLREGEVERAIALLKGAVSRLERSDMQHWLGSAYERQGDLAAAEYRYGLAMNLNPRQTISHLSLLRTLELQGKWDGVDHWARLLIQQSPRHPAGYVALANALVAKDKLEDAEELARHLVATFPERPESLLVQAHVQRHDGRVGDAAATLASGLERFPDSRQLIAEHAVAVGSVGRPAEGLMEVDDAIARLGDSGSLRRARAIVLLQAGRGREAAVEVERALELDPSELGALESLGDYHSMRGEFAAAAGAYERYAAARPSDASVWFRLAIARERSGDADGAVEAYRRAASADPGAAAPRNNLALLLERRGDLDGALEAAQAAYSLAEEEPAIIDTLGWVYFRKGASERAIALLEKASRIAPDSEPIREHLELARRERAAEEPVAALP